MKLIVTSTRATAPLSRAASFGPVGALGPIGVGCVGGCPGVVPVPRVLANVGPPGDGVTETPVGDGKVYEGTVAEGNWH